MAQAKKHEETVAEEATQAEVQEVREDPTTPELPNESTQPSSVSADEVVAAADADGVAVDEDAAQKVEDEDASPAAKAGRRSAKALREAASEEARQAAKEDRAVESDEPKAPRRQEPNPLHQHGKKYRAALAQVDRNAYYDLAAAMKLAVETASTKFDSSVEVHVNLGVDPRQADQMVRASVVLPHGTGRSLRVAVFADGAAAEAAQAAGADLVGTDKLLADIEVGKLDFDLLVATPDKMAVLGRVAKVLGPRGLMPNPKSGTVSPDVAKAVKDAKGGKVEFRIDKQAIVHMAIGKVSFSQDNLLENFNALVGAILKAKPAAAKGSYVKAISLSTSMGPGIKLDSSPVVAEVSLKR